MVRTVALYALFAAISIVVNIGTQIAVVANFNRGGIPISILAGTLTGLLTKYVLDKRWIFSHVSTDKVHEARTFLLYALMGVLTTLVFWGTEYLFHALFRSDAMRYFGGMLGLVVGYVMKYRLDQHFVFRATPSS